MNEMAKDDMEEIGMNKENKVFILRVSSQISLIEV